MPNVKNASFIVSATVALSTAFSAAGGIAWAPAALAAPMTGITSTRNLAVRTFSVTGSPRIHGTMAVGRTVEVVGRSGVFSPAPTAWRYQWFRGNWAIPGATQRTYTLRAADLGREISVRVTAVRSGVADRSIRTPARTVGARGTANAAAGTRSDPLSFGDTATIEVFDFTSDFETVDVRVTPTSLSGPRRVQGGVMYTLDAIVEGDDHGGIAAYLTNEDESVNCGMAWFNGTHFQPWYADGGAPKGMNTCPANFRPHFLVVRQGLWSQPGPRYLFRLP